MTYTSLAKAIKQINDKNCGQFIDRQKRLREDSDGRELLLQKLTYLYKLRYQYSLRLSIRIYVCTYGSIV